MSVKKGTDRIEEATEDVARLQRELKERIHDLDEFFAKHGLEVPSSVRRTPKNESGS